MGVPATEEWFSFGIRRNRKSYIFASILLTAILFVVAAALWFFGAQQRAAILILLLFGVPYAICGYSLTAQRLRDMGLTGWLALLWIPIGIADQHVGGAATLAFYIVLCCVPGSSGDNRYGPNPLQEIG